MYSGRSLAWLSNGEDGEDGAAAAGNLDLYSSCEFYWYNGGRFSASSIEKWLNWQKLLAALFRLLEEKRQRSLAQFMVLCRREQQVRPMRALV